MNDIMIGYKRTKQGVVPLNIQSDDRRQHTLILGKPGGQCRLSSI